MEVLIVSLEDSLARGGSNTATVMVMILFTVRVFLFR